MAKLLAVLNVLMLPKGHNHSFNMYLNSSELDCKCKRKTCHYTLVNKNLVQKFYEVRLAMSRPLKINSGYRCQSHNEAVGGVPHSSHSTGNAIDISTRDLSAIEKKQLLELLKNAFDYIKEYPTFIHAQINP